MKTTQKYFFFCLKQEKFYSRTLEEFIVIARGGEKFTQSVIKDDIYRAGVKHISISWEPAKTDLGNHLICVRAVDNTG